MRPPVLAALLAAAAVPRAAHACPERAHCFASVAPLRAEVPVRPQAELPAVLAARWGTVAVDLRLASTSRVAAARSVMTYPEPARATDDIEMPWIWQVLRTQVYSRMPRYERSSSFTMVLSPVVVSSVDDSVPGVGFAGDF